MAAAAVLSIGLTAGISVAGTPPEEPRVISTEPCAFGSENAEWSAPDGQRGFVVGCGRASGDNPFELLFVTNAPSRKQCLLPDFPRDGTHFIACHRAGPPPTGDLGAPEKIDFGLRVRGQPRAPADGYEGVTSVRVAAVTATFRHRGRPGRLPAGFVRPPAELLGRLGIRDPFGFYAARVPRGATRVRLVAADDAGRVLGRTAFRPNGCNTGQAFESARCPR